MLAVIQRHLKLEVSEVLDEMEDGGRASKIVHKYRLPQTFIGRQTEDRDLGTLKRACGGAAAAAQSP